MIKRREFITLIGGVWRRFSLPITNRWLATITSPGRTPLTLDDSKNPGRRQAGRGSTLMAKGRLSSSQSCTSRQRPF